MKPLKQIKLVLASIEPTKVGPILVKTPFEEVRKRLAYFEENRFLVTNKDEVLRYLEGAE